MEITTMLHSFIKAGAVLAFGSFALAGQALAVSPHPLNGAAPLVIPIQDEENEEVWKDLRPDVTPPEAAVGTEKEAPKGAAPEQPKEEGSGDVEQKELQEDGLEPK
jgi:hypothetical protein